MIRLVNIAKIYNAGKPNAFTALRGIDLTIPMQQITAFRGPSGSGKTTLLAIIGCMARPTSGRIWLGDRETTSLPERFATAVRRETFGFVFQNYNLIRGLSVMENIMIPAYPAGMKYRTLKDRAGELLMQMNMEDKAANRVEHLSGGEQQRVAIARALINDPEVIIADEPTAHLDTDMAGAFLEIVSALKAAGKTILIASHDPFVFGASPVDRLVSLRDGRLTAEEAAA